MGPGPTHEDEQQGNDFRQSGKGWSPCIHAGEKERFSAPGKFEFKSWVLQAAEKTRRSNK